MTTRPRQFLFTLWEGGGTLPPELGVARRLLARGHRVHVLADPTVADDARAAGCTFSRWREAPHRTSLDPEEDLLRDWEVSNPLAMLRRVRDAFVAGPSRAFADEAAAVIDEVAPDVVVPDFMLFGSIVAAQAAGIPVAPVIPNIWMLPTPGAPAIGPGFGPPRTALGRARNAAMLAMARRVFDGGLPTLNRTRAAHGLPPLVSFWDQVLGTDRILVLTSPTFDFGSAAAPPNARYVGPVLDDPSWANGDAHDLGSGDDRPLVLVGFSSTYQDQGPLLRRVVEALSERPVRGVVTVGQMLDPAEVPARENVEVVVAAPHRPLLEQAALAITHCGHGTTLKALAAGVPLVCLPMGRDQNDTAARVVHQGAGVRLSPGATARRIGRAIDEVLADDRYAAEARRMADVIRREQAEADVVGELERLAASPQPAPVS
jgi:MGT family glycosyltransferase